MLAMGDDDAMRAAFLMMALLMLVGPLFAQDQRLSAPNASRPAATTAPPNQKDRTLDRMGPAIDWDHRKPGRHWKITPSHKGADATGGSLAPDAGPFGGSIHVVSVRRSEFLGRAAGFRAAELFARGIRIPAP
jgi:hypothetical protein